MGAFCVFAVTALWEILADKYCSSSVKMKETGQSGWYLPRPWWYKMHCPPDMEFTALIL